METRMKNCTKNALPRIINYSHQFTKMKAIQQIGIVVKQ
jgi:hypothetical protein